MELAGVEALDLMRATMDEAFVGDDIAIRRIMEYLVQLRKVIQNLRTMLLSVKDVCKPEVFYNDIRPWFRGEDSQSGREWTFEGLELDPTLVRPTELSGPSAGQSALVHAIDIFLGVYKYSHGKELTGHSDTDDEKAQERRASFLKRMQLYMPRHQCNFLDHLASNPRPLRDLVATASTPSSPPATSSSDGKALLDAYNSTVVALKEFRDAHMIIVALYIVGPARRREAGTPAPEKSGSANAPLKGTGGSDLIQFLKGVRERTHAAIIPDTESTSGRP
jgi:indoleamine 2,3-dioxygenase